MFKTCAWAALVALALSASSAGAVSIGVGGFGGVSWPVVQDDTDRGSIFGIRAPVNLLPLITVEPYWATTSGGNKDETLGGLPYERSGLDVRAFGANVLIPFGTVVKLVPYAGIGTHKLTREGSDDVTKTGYNFGLGLGFSPPALRFSIDVRGELNAVVSGGASRKWANVTAGVTFNAFNVP